MRVRRLIFTLLAIASAAVAAHAQSAVEPDAEADSTAGKPVYVVDSVFQSKIDAILDSIYAEQNYLMSAADTSVYVPWRDTIVFKVDSTLLPKPALRDISDSLAVTVPMPVAFPDSVLRQATVVDSIATKLLRDSLDVLYNSFWKTDTLSRPLMDSLMMVYYESLGSNLPDAKDIKRAIRKNKQDYRDSVIRNTPRLLETFVVPDSLYYKQMLIWTHSPYTNDITLQERDTSANYNFYDNPAFKDDADAVYLGVMGSALQRTNYFKRETLKEASFFDPYMIYSYTPATLPMYNTKSPFTELAYWGNPFSSKQKEESSVKVLSTQNITPALNLTLQYLQFGGTGDLT